MPSHKNSRQKSDPDKPVAASSSFVSSAIASSATHSNANATDAIVQGMDAFRLAAEKLGAVDPKISQGNLFEYIEAAKFNAEAALKGSTLQAEVTAAAGDPHGAADLLIKQGDRTLRAVQAKSMNRPGNATAALSQEKYRGMQKLLPADQADCVQDLAGCLCFKRVLDLSLHCGETQLENYHQVSA